MPDVLIPPSVHPRDANSFFDGSFTDREADEAAMGWIDGLKSIEGLAPDFAGSKREEYEMALDRYDLWARSNGKRHLSSARDIYQREMAVQNPGRMERLGEMFQADDASFPALAEGFGLDRKGYEAAPKTSRTQAKTAANLFVREMTGELNDVARHRVAQELGMTGWNALEAAEKIPGWIAGKQKESALMVTATERGVLDQFRDMTEGPEWDWLEGVPEGERGAFEQAYWDSLKRASERYGDIRELVRPFVEEAKDGGTGEGVEAQVLAAYHDLDKDQRGRFAEALYTLSQSEGVDIEGFFQNVGTSFGRTFGDVAQGAALFLMRQERRDAEQVIETGEVREKKGRKTEARPATPEEIQQAKAEAGLYDLISDAKEARAMFRRLDDGSLGMRTANMIAASAPYFAAFSNPWTGALGATSFMQKSRDRLRREAPDMSPDDLDTLSNVIGGAEAAIQEVQNLTLGLRAGRSILPKNWVAQWTMRTIGSGAAETAEEVAQQFMHDLGKDAARGFMENVPESNYGQTLDELVKVGPELVLTGIFFGMLGATGTTVNDFTLADGLQKAVSDGQLPVSGLSPEAQERVTEAVGKDKMDGLRVYREEFEAQDPDERARNVASLEADELVKAQIAAASRERAEGDFIENRAAVAETVTYLTERFAERGVEVETDYDPDNAVTVRELAELEGQNRERIVNNARESLRSQGESVDDLTEDQILDAELDGYVIPRASLAGFSVKLAKGATVDTVIEEFSEGFLDIEIGSGRQDMEGLRAELEDFKKTGGLGENSQLARANFDSLGDGQKLTVLKEEFSNFVRGYARAVAEGDADAEVLPEGLGERLRRLLQKAMEVFRVVTDTARAILRAADSGTLSGNLDALAAQALGLDEDFTLNRIRTQEQEAILEDTKELRRPPTMRARVRPAKTEAQIRDEIDTEKGAEILADTAPGDYIAQEIVPVTHGRGRRVKVAVVEENGRRFLRNESGQELADKVAARVRLFPIEEKRRVSRHGPRQEAFRNTPLLKAIERHGGLLSKTRMRKKMGKRWKTIESDYNDAPEIRNPTHGVIYSTTGGQAPNTLAQAIYDDPEVSGVIEGPTARDLWAAINDAIAGETKSWNAEIQQERNLAERADFEGEAFTENEGEIPVSIGELREGESVVIDGEHLEVIHVGIDEDGYVQKVTLKDGTRWGLQVVEDEAATFWVEEYDKIPVGDFAPEEDLEPAADFSLESATEEELAAEERKAATRAEIEKRQAAQLEGNAGDLTADMFGEGETPLFNERRDATLAVSPQQDAAYLAAVERGDTEAQQRMVDEAARAAGYDVEAFHGSNEFQGDSEDFTTFDRTHTAYGFFFSPDEDTADFYAPDGITKRFYLKFNNLADLTDPYTFDKVAEEAIVNEDLSREEGLVEEWVKSLEDSEDVRSLATEVFREDSTGMSFDDVLNGLVEEGAYWVEQAVEDGGGALLDSLNEFAPKENRDLIAAREAHENLDQTWYMEYQDDFVRAAENLGYDGVFMYDQSPRGAPESYVALDPSQIKSADPVTYDEAGNVIPLSQRFNPQDDRITFAARLNEVPGYSRRAANLLPGEKVAMRRDTAERFVEIYDTLPSEKEMAGVALGGIVKRGWYRRSAHALLDVFGMDAPRFAALLAAMSPQTSVESNLINALNTWKNWMAAGRPTDPEAIHDIMGQSVERANLDTLTEAKLRKLARALDLRLPAKGGKKEIAAFIRNNATDEAIGRASVLGAWLNNSVRALTAAHPEELVISGPKVNSFMLNLRGVTNEVTNDAWMANYALIDQNLFKGSLSKSGPGKGPGYLAMSARVRAAAKYLTKLTGEEWTPAEVQETVWSWAKTLYELQLPKGEDRTALELLKDGELTDEKIAATPDFAILLLDDEYRTILAESGYTDALAELERKRDEGSGESPFRSPREAEAAASAAVRRAQEKAAKRLTTLREQRLAAGDATMAARPSGEGARFFVGEIDPSLVWEYEADPNDSIALNNAKVEVLETLDDAGKLHGGVTIELPDFWAAMEAMENMGDRRTLDEIAEEHADDTEKEEFFTRHLLSQWLIAEHGTTENWRETGYLTPDGQQISLAHYGNTRDKDHREINIPVDLPESGTGEMVAAMNAGMIRIQGSANMGGLSMRRPPTPRQIRALEEYFYEAGEIIADMEAPGQDGWEEVARETFEGTDDEIDRFFQKVRGFYQRHPIPTKDATLAARRPGAADALEAEISKLFVGVADRIEVGRRMRKRLRDVESRFFKRAFNMDEPTERMEITRALAQLDAIVSALPPTIRGKIGGSPKLSEMKTTRGRREELVRRLHKASTELEKYLEQEYRDRIARELKKSQAKVSDSRNRKGKIGAVAHAIADQALRAQGFVDFYSEKEGRTITVEEQVVAEAARFDAELAKIENPDFDDFERFHGMQLATELFADWENATVPRLEQALEFIQTNYQMGREEWLQTLKDRKAEREGIIEEVRELQGAPEYLSREQINNAKKARKKLTTRADEGMMGFGASHHQHFARIVENSKDKAKAKEWADRLTESRIRADLDTEQEIEDVREAFFGALGNLLGTTRGTKIRRWLYDMKQERENRVTTIEGRKVERVGVDKHLVDSLLRRDIGGYVDDKGNRIDLDERDLAALAASWEEYQDLPTKTQGMRKKVFFERVVAEGVRLPLGKLSEAEALQIYLTMRQPDQAAKLEEIGYDETTLAQLESFLSPEAKAMGQWMVDHLEKEGRALDKVHSSEFGVALATVFNYFPVKNRVTGEEVQLDPEGPGAGRTMSPSAIKQRVTNRAEPDFVDAFSVFFSHVAEMTYWKHNVGWVRKWGSVFRNQQFADRTRVTVGWDAYEHVAKFLTTVQNRGQAMGEGMMAYEGFIKKLNSRMALAVLGARVSTMWVNASAWLNALQSPDITVPGLLKQMVKIGLQPDGSLKETWRNELMQFRRRYGASFEAAMAMQTGKTGHYLIQDVEKLAQLGLRPMNEIDVATNTITMAAIYREVKEKAMKRGLSEEMAKAEADRAITRAVATISQPVLMISRSAGEVKFSRNPFGQMLVMFRSEVRKQAANNYMAWRTMLTGKGVVDRKTAARIAFVNSVIYPSVVAAMRELYGWLTRDEDDDEIEKRLRDPLYWANQMAADNLAAIPVVGDTLIALLAEGTGQRYWKNQLPLLRLTLGAYQNIEGVFEEGKTPSEVIDEVIDASQDIGALLPGGPALAEAANLAEFTKGLAENTFGLELSEADRDARLWSRVRANKTDIYANLTEQVDRWQALEDYLRREQEEDPERFLRLLKADAAKDSPTIPLAVRSQFLEE